MPERKRTIYEMALEKFSKTQQPTQSHIPPPPRHLKRGHHTDFALTRKDRDIVIEKTSSRQTRAILILLANNWSPAEILTFRADVNLAAGRLYRKSELHILAEHEEDDYEYDRPRLPKKHFRTLAYYSEGFNFTTTVTIWRRTKKALLEAHKRGDIYLPDLTKVPYPDALRRTKEEVLTSHGNRKELLSIIVRALSDPDNVEVWEENNNGNRHLFIDIILNEGK